MHETKETRVDQTLWDWLRNNPKKHLKLFQKGQLMGVGQYYCTGCRKILPLEEFENDEKMSTGVSSYCRHCDSSTGLPHEFLPPDDVENPRELSEFFQGKFEEAKRRGAKRVPRALANVVRDRFPDKVGYCSSCRRFHPVAGPVIATIVN